MVATRRSRSELDVLRDEFRDCLEAVEDRMKHGFSNLDACLRNLLNAKIKDLFQRLDIGDGDEPREPPAYASAHSSPVDSRAGSDADGPQDAWDPEGGVDTSLGGAATHVSDDPATLDDAPPAPRRDGDGAASFTARENLLSTLDAAAQDGMSLDVDAGRAAADDASDHAADDAATRARDSERMLELLDALESNLTLDLGESACLTTLKGLAARAVEEAPTYPEGDEFMDMIRRRFVIAVANDGHADENRGRHAGLGPGVGGGVLNSLMGSDLGVELLAHFFGGDKEAAVHAIAAMASDNVSATKTMENPQLALHAACVVARVVLLAIKARDEGHTLVVFGFGRAMDMLLQMGFDPRYMFHAKGVGYASERRRDGKLPFVSAAGNFETDPKSTAGDNIAQLLFRNALGQGDVRVNLCVVPHPAASATAGNAFDLPAVLRALRRALDGDVEGNIIEVEPPRQEFFEIERDLDLRNIACDDRPKARLAQLEQLRFKDEFILPVEARARARWAGKYGDPRAAWRCETCGMSRDEVPSLVGGFCRRCYDRARNANNRYAAMVTD